MMESTKLEYVKIKAIFLAGILALSFYSCDEDSQRGGILNCLLASIENTEDDTDIVIGQYNGWTDTTALIIITYHQKSMNLPITSNLKGSLNGNDIYFYDVNVDSLDKKKYKKIPSGIIWKKNLLEIEDNDYFSPPYDPMSLQIEYNFKKNCIGNIIKGEGYMVSNFESKCNYCIN